MLSNPTNWCYCLSSPLIKSYKTDQVDGHKVDDIKIMTLLFTTDKPRQVYVNFFQTAQLFATYRGCSDG